MHRRTKASFHSPVNQKNDVCELDSISQMRPDNFQNLFMVSSCWPYLTKPSPSFVPPPANTVISCPLIGLPHPSQRVSIITNSAFSNSREVCMTLSETWPFGAFQFFPISFFPHHLSVKCIKHANHKKSPWERPQEAVKTGDNCEILVLRIADLNLH